MNFINNTIVFILMSVPMINCLISGNENFTANIEVKNIHNGEYCPATTYSIYVLRKMPNLSYGRDDLKKGVIGGDDDELIVNESLESFTSLRINLILLNSTGPLFDKNLLQYKHSTSLEEEHEHNLSISLEDVCKEYINRSAPKPVPENKKTVTVTVGIPKTINCKSFSNNTNQTWSVHYKNEYCIYLSHHQLNQSQTVYFTFTPEAFDNNTIVWCHKTTDEKNKVFHIRVKGKSENDIATLSYNSSEPVWFDCEKEKQTPGRNSVTYVGEVNKSSIIKTDRKRSSIFKTFGEADNGTMLCCLHFEETNEDNDIIITRQIKRKILLIYNETDEGTESKELYIIYAAVGIGLVVTLVTLLLIVSKVKKLRNKTSPREMELDTYATLNRVEYADLQGLRENAQPPSFSNDSQYAKIIGIIKPKQ